MFALVRNTLEGMLQEAALDLTRFGQRLSGRALTPKPVPFLTADVVIPQPDLTAKVDPSAVLMGQLFVRRHADIGPSVVVRGETGVVDIGRETKIGAESVVIADSRRTDNPFLRTCQIGPNVTIGSRVVLTNCRIESKAVIGDDCRVGEGAIVESGAVLEKGTVVPAGRLVPKETRWGGNPAKFLGAAHSDHH